jgi:hypothetical protein
MRNPALVGILQQMYSTCEEVDNFISMFAAVCRASQPWELLIFMTQPRPQRCGFGRDLQNRVDVDFAAMRLPSRAVDPSC